MTCKSCGREIVENSIFCNWCGEKQLAARCEALLAAYHEKNPLHAPRRGASSRA